MGESMKQNNTVVTLALLGALALAALFGVLLAPSDSVVHAVHINAPTNNTPAFSDSSGRSVPENTPAGANIGAPISATDADGDTLTYSLGGTDEASFDIDTSTGQITTKADLDRETESSYEVTVTVDDGTGGSDSSATQDVDITVTDVEEPPAAPVAPVVTTGSTQNAETTTPRGQLVRAREHRARHHRLRLQVQEDDGNQLGKGPRHDERRHKRHHFRARSRHRLPGIGARDQRRGYRPMVPLGDRLHQQGWQRRAGVPGQRRRRAQRSREYAGRAEGRRPGHGGRRRLDQPELQPRGTPRGLVRHRRVERAR